MTTPALDRIYHGDALEVIRSWPDGFVQTVVTSPPYWGLRDYGVAGQIGLEKTPEEYVAKMVELFRDVRRVLRADGTLWLNLGDSYNGSGPSGAPGKQYTNVGSQATTTKRVVGLKPKDLVGIPWRVAFALQADGWYLRSDIIWAKKNCMPESVTDRPTRAHEYIFLMTKSPTYFYDAEAIKEKAIYRDDARPFGNAGGNRHGDETRIYHPLYKDAKKFDGKNAAKEDKQRGHSRRHAGFNDRWDAMEKAEQCSAFRNKRSWWPIATHPFPEAHFATFPEELITPCILAGAPSGGLVFDPFMGAGTTALVAAKLNRRFIGTELNPEYIKMAECRIAHEVEQQKMF